MSRDRTPTPAQGTWLAEQLMVQFPPSITAEFSDNDRTVYLDCVEGVPAP